MSEDPTPYKTRQNFIVDLRINQIGFQASSLEKGSFIKYSPNPYFGKLQQYLDNGWTDQGDHIQYKEKYGTIAKSLFLRPETHYVIGDLKYLDKEDCFQLTSVGDRILNVMVDKKNRDDFYEVYLLAEKKMMELIDMDEINERSRN
jgi:hypothetical protein